MANTSHQERAKRVIPQRLYILFTIIILLFSGLVARLAYMQIVNKNFYLKKLETASQRTITTSSVRGGIFDAQGRPLVENEIKQVVSYTRSNTQTAAEMKTIAGKLLEIVSLPEVRISGRDKVDYYLSDPEVYAKVVKALPEDQRLDEEGNLLPESTIYANAVASVPEDSLTYSEEESRVIDLFTQMNGASHFATVNLVTNPLSAEQIARIAASEKELPGISTATNWDRKILPTSLSSIIGTVTTEQAGLPAEDKDDYLAKGYSLNDRVGTAYLEKQYESVLQGQHEKKEIYLDRNGEVESIQVVQEGSRGKNIKLTLDLTFQDGVNAILKRYLSEALNSGAAAYSPGTYAVVLNPKTGAVLAMAGYKHDKGSQELKEDTLGTITNVFVPGSIVKGATITAGWEHNIIAGNQVLTDKPIQFAGSQAITSWYTVYGNRDINAVQALEFSSNTYMVQLALGILGVDYIPGMYVEDLTNLPASIDKLRATFAEYGLGTSTGIDLPGESEGYLPDASEMSFANYLTDSFGQFDNYTPMQMAQYAATVANGGKRIAPHVVQGVYASKEDGSMGDLLEEVTGKEMNTVATSPENMTLIQEGFRQVVYGLDAYTTGRVIGYGASVPISAKTGTAETFITTETGEVKQAINTNVIAYAPSHNPQIAVAVIMPDIIDLKSDTSKHITRDIINLYHSMYPMN